MATDVETYIDPEFGEIVIRRTALARAISVRVAPDGRLRASMPLRAPERLLRRLLDEQRDAIARMLAVQNDHVPLHGGMAIGKSHTLLVSAGPMLTAKVTKNQLAVTLPSGKDLNDLDVESFLTPYIIKTLRQEARAYLPRRLEYLAARHGFSFESSRFSHASSRWGSCSSRGTISLNIALMKLPFELIDYVIYHELSHLKHMNHSAAFWALVASLDPAYKEHRRVLKTHNPSVYI